MTFSDAHPFPADAIWQALVTGTRYYIALLDLSGTVRYASWASGGDQPSSGVGQSVADLMPDAAPAIMEAIRAATETADDVERDIPLPIDNVSRWFRASISAIREPSGAPTGVLVIGHDVTKTKQSAVELRMSVNALHRLLEAREQLSADMHDGILQSLYGLGLRLSAARATLATDASATGLHLDQAVAQVSDAMAEVRRVIRDEGGPGSMGIQWNETLAGVLRGLELVDGPALSIDIPPQVADRIPEQHRRAVVYFAREGVSNAMRHSNASRVAVRLDENPDGLCLEIEDDGQGIPAKRSADGFGLLNMTRRAAQMGARLTLNTAPGEGTRVRLDLPIHGAKP